MAWRAAECNPPERLGVARDAGEPGRRRGRGRSGQGARSSPRFCSEAERSRQHRYKWPSGGRAAGLGCYICMRGRGHAAPALAEALERTRLQTPRISLPGAHGGRERRNREDSRW